MPIHVLIAPSGFKEGLDVSDVADAMARGVRRALPDCTLTVVPVFDGGEGFTRALVRLNKGRLRHISVTGPVGEPVKGLLGLASMNGQRTAIIEISSAAGLRLVPRERRNLMSTTSRGVGELIRAALDAKARRILIGCGDSGVNDGGVGMAQALGVRFLDRRKTDLKPGGFALSRLHSIDLSGIDPRIKDTEIEVCLNIRNMLVGSNGVSRVFGPQKGATPQQVEALEAAMSRYAACVSAVTDVDVSALPGGGASGGLGAALHALFGARLIPRYEFIQRFIPLTDLIEKADIIVSAEGRIDRQTCRGKIPGEIARHAKVRGKPVIVLAGAIGEGAEDCYKAGISAYVSIIDQPYNLVEAIDHSRVLLQGSTERLMRILAVGNTLSPFAVRK